MKSLLLSILLLTFLITTNSYSQDIKAKLGGNTSENGFSVIDVAGDTLFRVNGEGKIRFGKGNPNGWLSVFYHLVSGYDTVIIKTKDGDQYQNGTSLSLEAGKGNSEKGGSITLRGGAGQDGGDINLLAGPLNEPSGNGGNIDIQSGPGYLSTTKGGDVTIRANGGGERSGNIDISTATGVILHGNISLRTGTSSLPRIMGINGLFDGNILLETGSNRAGNNTIELITGENTSGGIGGNDIILTIGNSSGDGGNIQLTPGLSDMGGPDGLVIVNGSGTVSGSWTVSSDKRFKKNIEPLENSLDKIERLNSVSYEFRNDEFPDKKFKDGKQIGFIAQDVEKIIPEIVETDNEGYKSIDYAKINVLLVEAIKEQQKSIELLKKEVELLKSSAVNYNVEVSSLGN